MKEFTLLYDPLLDRQKRGNNDFKSYMDEHNRRRLNYLSLITFVLYLLLGLLLLSDVFNIRDLNPVNVNTNTFLVFLIAFVNITIFLSLKLFKKLKWLGLHITYFYILFMLLSGALILFYDMPVGYAGMMPYLGWIVIIAMFFYIPLIPSILFNVTSYAFLLILILPRYSLNHQIASAILISGFSLFVAFFVSRGLYKTFYISFIDKQTIIKQREALLERNLIISEDLKEKLADLDSVNQKLKDEIVERKKTEKDLMRSNEDLKKYSFIISHDLREPFRAIVSYLQLLKKKYGHQLDDDAKEYIGYAVCAAIRLDRVIIDLQDYSLIHSSVLTLESVNMNALLKNVLIILSDLISENDAKIQYGELPEMIADRNLLIRVFMVLLENAIRYQKKDQSPQINIYCEIEEDDYVFFIADNGIGIDPAYHQKVFEIFQRLHKLDEFPGLGMGLAVAKRIIDVHSGEIDLQSVLGEGTTVRFSIPKIKS